MREAAAVGDDSTPTSFTEQSGPKPGQHPLIGSHGGVLLPDGEAVDSRNVEDEARGEEDEEPSQREGAEPREGAPAPQPDAKPPSRASKEFWAALSVHAAAAVMAGPGSAESKRAAASAAAKSLLEDGQAMERANEQLARERYSLAQSGQKPPKALKPVRITPQLLRNAASKASVAVLQNGADQGVAAAVASAILIEGGSMLGRARGRSKQDKYAPASKPFPSGGSRSSGDSHGSESTEKTANSDKYARPTAEEPREQEAEEARDDDGTESLASYDSTLRPRAEDAETQLSFSASRFGRGDKYALTDAAATAGAAANDALLSPVYEEAALASINEKVARMSEKERKIEKLSEAAALEAVQDAVAGLDEDPIPSEGAEGKGGGLSVGSDNEQSQEEASTTSPKSREHPIIKASASLSGAMEMIAPPSQIAKHAKERAPAKPSCTLQAVPESEEQDEIETKDDAFRDTDSTVLAVTANNGIEIEYASTVSALTASTGTTGDASQVSKAMEASGTQCQTDEEAFEQKQAGLLAAMGVLKKKLDELEQCKGQGTGHANAEGPQASVDTVTVGTDVTHSYAISGDATDGASSAGGSKHGRYSIPGASVASLIAPGPKGVLRKPTKFFSTVDLDEALEATWEEDGTVYNSIGECRIRAARDDESTMEHSSMAKEAEEASMEVVLVVPNPASPSARLRQVREFFARKSRKVTFDDNVDGSGHEVQLSSKQAKVESDGAPLETENNPKAANSKGRAATRSAAARRDRPRRSLLKKLRKGSMFKAGAKKDDQRATNTMFAAHDVNVAITPIVEYVAPEAKSPEKADASQNDARKEDATKYIVDASGVAAVDGEDANKSVKTDNSGTKASQSSTAAGNGAKLFLSTPVEGPPSHRSKTAEGKKMAALKDSRRPKSDSSSSSPARRSVHMDVSVDSMPTYYSTEVSDDSWVDSALSRLHDTLIGPSESSSYYDDDASDLMTYASSANESMATDFTSVARFNFV